MSITFHLDSTIEQVARIILAKGGIL